MNENYRPEQYFGNYRLLHRLKPDTEIYIGEHISSHTKAAIKLLNGDKESDDVAKFLAQASLLMHLQHPHIVQIFDFGMVKDTAFLIMNYAPNGTLRQCYPKGTRLPLSTIVHYVKQLASALQYIHMHKLIHRDIKPHNMLLGPDNDILLTDFGIAVVSQSFDPSSPAFRDFEGTVPYASPEQLQGKPCCNSDLYSLGVVVYEWLCGTWPFSGSFDEIVHQHLFVAPPSFHEKGVDVPADIEQIVLQTLAKEPEERFSAVEDFAYALEQAYQTTQLHDLAADLSLLSPARRQFMSPLPFTG